MITLSSYLRACIRPSGWRTTMRSRNFDIKLEIRHNPHNHFHNTSIYTPGEGYRTFHPLLPLQFILNATKKTLLPPHPRTRTTHPEILGTIRRVRAPRLQHNGHDAVAQHASGVRRVAWHTRVSHLRWVSFRRRVLLWMMRRVAGELVGWRVMLLVRMRMRMRMMRIGR